MARLKLSTVNSLNYLSSNTFHSEKTNKDYYNINFFDDHSGSTFQCNSNETLYNKLQACDALVSCDCIFELDTVYNRLHLIDLTLS